MVSQNSSPESLILDLTMKPLPLTAGLSLSGCHGPSSLLPAMEAPELMFIQHTHLPCSDTWKRFGLHGNPSNSRVRLS